MRGSLGNVLTPLPFVLHESRRSTYLLCRQARGVVVLRDGRVVLETAQSAMDKAKNNEDSTCATTAVRLLEHRGLACAAQASLPLLP